MLQRLRKLALHLFSFLSITETHRPGRFFVTAVPARVIEWCWEINSSFHKWLSLLSELQNCVGIASLPSSFPCHSVSCPCVYRFLPVCSWGQMSSSGSFLYSFTPGFWRQDWLWNPELTISISEPWRTTTLYASLHMLQCWGGGCALPYLTWTWVASFLVQGFHSFIASTFYNLPSPQSLGFWAELFILLISNWPTFYG